MSDGPHGTSVPAERRFGVFGGTFDPPHMAHLVLAQEALFQLNLERVYFIPTGQSPHKLGRVISPAAERREMVERAIAHNPAFAVCTVEVDRPGPSYTAQTLQQLHAHWGPATHLYLILGWDMLLDLPNWYDPFDVVRQVSGLAVMDRPGYDDHKAQLAQVAAALPDLPSKLVRVPAPRLEISATDVRQRVAAGHPIRYLVPDSVAAYIAEHQLYRSEGHGADHAPHDATAPRSNTINGDRPGAETGEVRP